MGVRSMKGINANVKRSIRRDHGVAGTQADDMLRR